ncbi:MAG: 4-(cytidine 5'-diphospho)-2-C-methyl-D-erythritol kinase [Solirubrobacteraceae bacterium]
MSPQTLTAPAKINLCLLLGGTRDDGRHELVTLFESVSLTDILTVSVTDADAVVCEGVPGPNLVADALAGLRAAGWAAPPLRVQIDKRIPIAAGMGGGSADAAALLRHASEWAPVAGIDVAAFAARLGADVPAALQPGVVLGTGAGEVLADVPTPPAHAILVLPQDFGLATADVYREADLLGLGRSRQELAAGAVALMAGATSGRLGVNDLQPAALSLRPEIADALAAARAAGAEHALVCGSGPTVIGLYPGADGLSRAQGAATRLRDRWPRAVAVTPV